MSVFLPQLISWLQEYGYFALWLAICIAAAGVPLPILLVLLAAGSFSALGDFNIFVMTLVAISASVCGDSVGYVVGRRWGIRLLDRLDRAPRRPLIAPHQVARGRTYFARGGGWAIFLSRFLISGLGGIINLLAGADPYPYRRFLLAAASGETLGATIPLGLGYIFGASWEQVGALLGDVSLFFLAALVVVILAISLIRTVQRAKVVSVDRAPPVLQSERAVSEAYSQPRASGKLPP